MATLEIYCPEELKRDVEDLAASLGCSANDLVQQWIKEFLDENRKRLEVYRKLKRREHE